MPLTSALLFAAFYIASIAALFGIAPPEGLAGAQIRALTAVTMATIAAGLVLERRLPSVGLLPGLHATLRGLAWGIVLAAGAVGGAHLLILLTTDARMRPGAGFPGLELLIVVVPAVLHEELLFRGFAFQRLLAWNVPLAVALSSVVFAALHLGNEAIGPLSLVNIALAGVLLALSYLVFRNLWAPLGVHFGWNALSGPVLGHEISGWQPPVTAFVLKDPGPALLTGGSFGIEGSVWITLTELLACAVLWRRLRNGTRRGAVDNPDTPNAHTVSEGERNS